MAVAILDAASESASGLHANISVSAGSNRWVYLVVYTQDGSEAGPPSAMTLGGQTMTLIAGGAATAGYDVSTSVWALNEAGIAAMSGTAVGETGIPFGNAEASTWWSIQDADQGSHTVNAASTTGTSGTVNLARVADGFTGAASCHDTISGWGAITNPSSGGDFTFGAGIASYGYEASTSETVDYTWANSSPRNNESAVWNIGPAAGGGGSTIPVFHRQYQQMKR